MSVLPSCLALVTAALLFAGTPVSASGGSADMQTEIDRLLAEVESSDCVFIRNGREHSADAAADHLRMKRRRGKRYFDSTETFIERLASRSSWSGRDYRIRCDGETVTAAEWFADRLKRIRSAQGADAP